MTGLPPPNGDYEAAPATFGGGSATRSIDVRVRRDGITAFGEDCLALEEPLEIRLESEDSTTTLAITMRTPGHDFELVAGFLLSEGVIESREQVCDLSYCLDGAQEGKQRFNVVKAVLRGPVGPASIERLVATSSACGICGSASIEAVRLAGHPALGTGPAVPMEKLSTFPDLLRAGQRGFSATGGVHGIALISSQGYVRCLREDVGRHNAVDKVVGWATLEGLLPLSQSILMVSGRISFEIVQKALRAGIPVVAAVSAATSLAVDLARETGMTLVGFLRNGNCTIYAGEDRVTE